MAENINVAGQLGWDCKYNMISESNLDYYYYMKRKKQCYTFYLGCF